MINNLLGDNYSPEVVRELADMREYDLFDVFAHFGYRAAARTRIDRGDICLSGNTQWFATMPERSAIVLRALGPQFQRGGTETLESMRLFDVQEIRAAGGLAALGEFGKPKEAMSEAKVVFVMKKVKRPLREVCDLAIEVRDPRQGLDEEFVYVDISAVNNKTKQIGNPKPMQGKYASVRARQVIHTGDIEYPPQPKRSRASTRIARWPNMQHWLLRAPAKSKRNIRLLVLLGANPNVC